MGFIDIKVFADRADIRKVLANQKFILQELLNLRKDMAKASDDIRAAIDEIKDAAQNISADIDRLASQAEGGLTAEEATGFVEELRTVGTQLRAVADKNPEEPEIPEEPIPEEPTPEV
jgi:methyl-accepting chemotaxis protein